MSGRGVRIYGHYGFGAATLTRANPIKGRLERTLHSYPLLLSNAAGPSDHDLDELIVDLGLLIWRATRTKILNCSNLNSSS